MGYSVIASPLRGIFLRIVAPKILDNLEAFHFSESLLNFYQDLILKLLLKIKFAFAKTAKYDKHEKQLINLLWPSG